MTGTDSTTDRPGPPPPGSRDPIRYWVTGCWVTMILILGFYVWSEDRADADRERDRVEAAEEACVTSYEVRDQYEAIFADYSRRLGSRLGADPAEVDEFNRETGTQFDALPTPSPCETSDPDP